MLKWSKDKLRILAIERDRFYRKLKKQGIKIPSVKLAGPTNKDKKRYKKSFAYSRKTAAQVQAEETERVRRSREIKGRGRE